ncbi:MAG: helix-turn-helix domain-containing protein [Mycobacteriales bacterium]
MRDADPVVLGQRIRNLRLARGLTQSGLADGAVTVGYISRIEAGQRRPDVALLERFAAVLGTTADHIVTGVEPARADEIMLTLLNAELALETGAAGEALDTLGGVTGLAGADLPPEARQRADFLRARALEAVGRYDEAIVALEQVIEATAPNGPFLPALIALSRCHRETGELNLAIEVGERALEALKEGGIDGGDESVRLAVTVAAAYFERGDVGHAVRMALRAVDQAEKMGSPQAQAAAYWNASAFESGRGNAAAAIPLAERAIALLALGEDRRNLARLRAQLGVMLLALDPPRAEDAADHLGAARHDLTESSASVVDVAHCDLGLARAWLVSGDTGRAVRLASEVLEATSGIAPAVAADAASLLGQVELAHGDVDGARVFYLRAVALLTGTEQDRRAAQLWLELGAQLEHVGDSDGARDAYRRAAVASGLQLPSAVRVSR